MMANDEVCLELNNDVKGNDELPLPLRATSSLVINNTTGRVASHDDDDDIQLDVVPSFLHWDHSNVVKPVPSKRKRKHIGKNHIVDTKQSLLQDYQYHGTKQGMTKKFSFSLNESFKQSTKGTIYSLIFSEPLPATSLSSTNDNTSTTTTSRLLATCCKRNLVIYRITTETTTVPDTTATSSPLLPVDDGTTSGSSSPTNQPIKIHGGEHNTTQVQYCYVDTEENEDYYACTFVGRVHNPSSPDDGTQLVCVGGKNCRILVIDCTRHCVVTTLSGHGGHIHDLQVCPTNEWLLLSASNDYTCRLWNVRAMHHSPIAIFGGHNGHVDGVNKVSWHVSGTQFVSGGIDNTIKIWDITEDVRDAIISSNTFTDSILDSTDYIDQSDWIATVIVQFPIFSTNRVHAHCVDCVEFLGDLIVSKSTENVIQLWYPIITTEKSPFGDLLQPPSSDVILLRTFHYDDGELWFIRFAIEPEFKLLVVGTSGGTVTIWNICDENHRPVLKPIRHLYINRESTIRCVQFSPDGSMLFASTDDGSIYQWTVAIE